VKLWKKRYIEKCIDQWKINLKNIIPIYLPQLYDIYSQWDQFIKDKEKETIPPQTTNDSELSAQ